MKHTTPLVMMASALLITPVQAHRLVFEGADNSLETRLCETAGNEGMDAARALAKENGLTRTRLNTIYCNDKPLQDMVQDAAKIRQRISDEVVTVRIVTGDASGATRACKKAAEGGMNSFAYRRAKSMDIRCNNLTVREFVQKARP